MDSLMDMFTALKEEMQDKFMPKIGFAVVSAGISVLLLVGGGLGGMMLSDIRTTRDDFSKFKEEATQIHTTRGKDIEANTHEIVETKQDISDINYKLDQIMQYVVERTARGK